MRLLCLFAFLYFVPNLVFAQRFSFIQYNTNKGLPQSQVSTITQDDDGYLWIGTYGGLARFDGNNFNIFGRNSGLLNNRITKLYFIDDLLYIGHPQGISVKDKNDHFSSFPYSSPQLLEDITSFGHIDSTIYVATNGGGLFLLDKNAGLLTSIQESPLRIRDMIQHRGILYLATRSGLYQFDGKKCQLLNSSSEISFSGLTVKNDHLIATSFNGTLYKINFETKNIVPILTHDHFLFRNVFIDHKGHKWVNSRDGILLIKSTDTLQITEGSGLPSNDINVIFEDSEQNIWMGTNGKGLIRFTGDVFTYYSEKSGFPSDLIIDIEIDAKNNTWISTIDQGVFKIDTLNQITKIDYISSVVWQILSIDNLVLFASNFGLFTYDYKQFNSFYSEENQLPSDRIRGIRNLNDTTLLISTTEGTVLFNTIQQQIHSTKNKYQSIKNARDFEILDGILYAAAPNGIYTVKDDKVTHKFFDLGVNCIELDFNGKLWIGTENGLFIKNKEEYKRFYLEKEEEALEYINFLQKIDTLLLVGTNNGLYELDVKNNRKHRYGISAGLIDLETNLNSSFIEDNRYLWFGTASGLMRMDINLKSILVKSFQPQLQLTHITINNKGIEQAEVKQFNSNEKKEALVVKYTDKNISFEFDGIYMSNPSALRYSYFLEGFSNDWSIPTANSNVSFTNLPPGKYTLKFKVDTGIDKASKTFVLPLEILPPFYLTWWFYIIIGGIILLTIISIDRARTKRRDFKDYQLKLEFQNKLSKLKQQSLNASMNRHFIFNALNSIQYYINISDTKSANKYLSRFAKLIRKNLDSSYNEDGMVTLSDELERLKLYLDLESMRFINRFDFEFHIEESIEPELLKVPTMFLQPFVENSIIHGILPLKDKKGKIDIIISDYLDHIQIEIKDNGVGIEKSISAKAEDPDNHKSQGMMIAKGRIELLQKISKRFIEMIGPHEIRENDGSINGTTVIFKITKQYLG